MSGDGEYDPAVHLSFSDVSFDHPSNPTVIQVNIKASPVQEGGAYLFGENQCRLMSSVRFVGFSVCLRVLERPVVCI